MLPALRLHVDLGEVVAGAGFQQVEPLAVAAVGLAEAEIPPGDVAEMAVGAGHHEADRHQGNLAAVVVLEPLPVVDAAIAVVQQRPSPERARVALDKTLGDLLGEGPLREAQGLDRASGLGEGFASTRRRAQLHVPHPGGGAHQLQQPLLVDRFAALNVPVIQATDHHGIAGQVDHGAGAIKLQHLALAGLPDRGDAAT